MSARRNTGSSPRVLGDDPRARRASQALSAGIASGRGVGVDTSGRFTTLLGDALYFDDRGRVQIRTGGGLTIAPGSPRRLVYDPSQAEARVILVLAAPTTDDVVDSTGTGDTVTALLQRLQDAYQAEDTALDARVTALEAVQVEMGTFALTGATPVVVPSLIVTSDTSKCSIQLTRRVDFGSSAGHICVTSSIRDGESFEVISSDASDDGTVQYEVKVIP